MSKLMILCLLFSLAFCFSLAKYEPNWESLESRPLPSWFDEAKFGIFLHWGIYSVPSAGSEWFWSNWKISKRPQYVDYMKKNYRKSFTYGDFAQDFTAEFFNANDWAEIIASSGAKYVVLTTKHHDGYALWPSKYSFNWNSKDVGPERDLVGELAAAVRKKGLIFGTYHSLLEWFNPMYLSDKKNNFTTKEFVHKKVFPEMKELVETYKPSIMFSDGEWEAPDTYWNSTDFLAWLYNESPVKDFVVTNDRWGKGLPCHHGGYFTCKDGFNPGSLQKRKFETAMKIDIMSWGYRRVSPLRNFRSPLELISQLVKAVSCGGNILMNVGPRKDGLISPIFQDRLKSVGDWLSINGEAIYGTKPWNSQNDTLTSDVWFTSKKDVVYAIALFWPKGNVLKVEALVDLLKTPSMKITLLGSDGSNLKYAVANNLVSITFPDKATIESNWAYVLKIVK